MPKIIQVSLTPQQRIELNQRARARQLSPRMRDRLEMVRLSDMGQSVAQITQVLQVHEATVRKYLKHFTGQKQPFVITAQASVATQPAKGALDNPSARQYHSTTHPLLSLGRLTTSRVHSSAGRGFSRGPAPYSH